MHGFPKFDGTNLILFIPTPSHVASHSHPLCHGDLRMEHGLLAFRILVVNGNDRDFCEEDYIVSLKLRRTHLTKVTSY